MIKLIAFDLDGVLIDAKDIHYDALNEALCEIDTAYRISIEDHLGSFDGLPTLDKLKMLTESRGLPQAAYGQIWDKKQQITIDMIKSRIPRDERLISIFQKLKLMGITICVASNSIRETIKHALIKTGLMEYVDFFISNQDVSRAKPNPEMYLKAMIMAGVGPKETIVIEDSRVGQRAASDSGAHLHPVKTGADVTKDSIIGSISKINELSNKIKWRDDSLNILIPMAGHGSRFELANYTFPKPLIDVLGKPMIQMVVENLNISANYIYVVRKEHYNKYNLQYMLNLITPNCKIILTDGVTEGAACTALLTKELINNDSPLILANSDQYVEWNSSEFMYTMHNSDADGGILTFTSISPKWSFIRKDESGLVAEVAEKRPISDEATCGIYWFRHGKDFVSAAEQMINKNIRVNNEFYVCPIFNEMIADGKIVRSHHIERMWGTGTPEDLNTFLTRNEKA